MKTVNNNNKNKQPTCITRTHQTNRNTNQLNNNKYKTEHTKAIPRTIQRNLPWSKHRDTTNITTTKKSCTHTNQKNTNTRAHKTLKYWFN